MSELQPLIDAATQGNLSAVTAILDSDGALANQRDESGATPLHYAAFHGHREVVRLLVQRGADLNSTDSRFGATPAGWAIEYLREIGGFLGIELDDFAYAIQRGDALWVARFLKRFPALRRACDTSGRTFHSLARASGNSDVIGLFEAEGRP